MNVYWDATEVVHSERRGTIQLIERNSGECILQINEDDLANSIPSDTLTNIKSYIFEFYEECIENYFDHKVEIRDDSELVYCTHIFEGSKDATFYKIMVTQYSSGYEDLIAVHVLNHNHAVIVRDIKQISHKLIHDGMLRADAVNVALMVEKGGILDA